MKNKRQRLRQSVKIIVKADKTDNYYALPCDLYNKLLKDNITTLYRRGRMDIVRQINDEARDLADRLKMSDRVQKLGRQESYITLKDHKENFPARITCRLINPSKTEMGRISKKILQRIVHEIREKTGLNQWRNTRDALNWFNSLQNTKNAKFIQADVEAFYPSITKELLLRSLAWAKTHTYISDLSIDIIIHCRRGVLWHEGQVWVKKTDPNFDVTMGSFDGAECCDIVGLFLLHQITETHEILGRDEVGLFRDDLAGITRGGGPIAERKKKELIRVIKSEGLAITADCNLTTINFLDVTMTINNKEHKPFMKMNAQLQYLDTRSNHPPVIKKNIAAGVEQRLSDISSSKKAFTENIRPYQEALEKAGHKHLITFQGTNNESDNGLNMSEGHNLNPNTQTQRGYNTTASRKKNRKRNVIWYNPPFNDAVKTDVGKVFLNLIKKHFGQNKELRKLFNKNNMKVSYSCGRNVRQDIQGHNKFVLKSKLKEKEDRMRELSGSQMKLCSSPRKVLVPPPG